MSASYTVIDISKYNTASNYTTAASNIDGVIIRAGYRGYGASGTLVTDSLFETHYSGFKDLTKIGVYWFSQAITTTEAVNEANYLYNLIKDKEIDFPIYINSDYANSSQSGRADNLSKTERTTMLVALCDRLTQLGYSTGVYASESWFNTSLDLDTIQEKEYSLIVTKYSETQPSITDYDAWNYTASAIVNGINNVCNMSTFYKDVAGWVTVKPDIADYEIVVEQTEFDYTGEEIEPAFTVVGLLEGTDYGYIYSNNINAGTGTCRVYGINAIGGSTTFDFTINPITITDKEFSISPTSIIYTGNPIRVNIIIEDLDYNDYDTSYSNNINVGTASVTVTGIGNYKDSLSANFEITCAPLEEEWFSIAKSSYKYNGYPIEPEVISSKSGLTQDIDYIVTYSNNINIGTATITITGIGNYDSSVSLQFNISNMDITEYKITLDEYTYIYDGNPKTPIVTVEDLVLDEDYRVSYSNNINAGMAKLIVTGIGDYTGTKELNYTITRQSIYNRELVIVDDITVYYFNTKAITPEVYIEGLKLNTDYNISYTNNTNPGTATITAYGINNYDGKLSTTFTILTNNINTCIAKFGRASTKTIYRILTDGILHIYTDNTESIELTNMVDYTILSSTITSFPDFNMYVYEVRGLSGYTGSITYRFRIIDEEPDTPIDYEDDGVYNFGDIDIGDETAEGDYDFGDLDEGIDPDTAVIDNYDYDFDKMSGLLLDSYDDDDGKNIDKDGKTEEEEKESKEDDDDGVYNFGDIDTGDETAEGDYDFGDLDEGIDPDTAVIDGKDYDFNKHGDEEEKWVDAGTEFELVNVPMYETYSSNAAFAIRSGLYYVFNSTIANNRIRMCRSDFNVERPAKISGWCSITDLANIGKFVIGDKVLVTGKLYKYASGTGGYIVKDKEEMYIRDIFTDDGYDYPYALSSNYKTARVGFASKDILTKIID